MYIARVRVENVRGFHDARSVDLGLERPDGTYAGWTVIAGRNGSGKTSLLRAIALAISGHSSAGVLMPDSSNWITVGRDAGSVGLDLVADPVLDLSGEGDVSEEPLSLSMSWRLARPLRATGRDPQPLLSSGNSPSAWGPWQPNAAGWFCAAYGPFRRLTGGSIDAQRLTQGPAVISRLASLFHEDASLAEGVSWLIDQHLRSFERRSGAAELKEAALAVLADGLLPDGYVVRGVDADGLWVDNNDRRFPLREMSDGYRAVTALVVDLLKQIHDCYGEIALDETEGSVRVVAPGVVVIDEVDAHLHVTWQKRIGTWLKSHFPNMQFIVTTHSPYVCQSADPGGLIRLPGPDQDESPRVVSEDLYERVVYGSGDDAALSGLFGLESSYSDAAQRLRRELVELEYAVVVGSASPPDIERYRHISGLLTSSPKARVDEVAARLAMRPADQ
ncbi:AAA family ATPase [Catenuloplanes japonicus]|uniref:AAA family ATPase n=1 Tax=Catenuloplanes japonicus TaxID=33876 RepID=UPI000526BB66|nr:AAA family ATPase [Catenuloplanes japonicus]